MKKVLVYMLSLAMILGSIQVGAVKAQAADANDVLTEQNMCGTSYENNFEKHNDSDMSMPTWENGANFDCRWEPQNISFNDGIMEMRISNAVKDEENGQNTNYTAAEYRTKKYFGYGRYRVRMKPSNIQGTASTFFLYTGPWDSIAQPHDEIDIEFLGKDTTKVQFNYFTHEYGAGKHEHWCDLGFDASKDFHTYGFDWYEGGITWYVDEKPVYSVPDEIDEDKKPDDVLPTHPGMIMINLWPGTTGPNSAEGWMGKFEGIKDNASKPVAYYDWISYDANFGGDSYVMKSGNNGLVMTQKSNGYFTVEKKDGKTVLGLDDQGNIKEQEYKEGNISQEWSIVPNWEKDNPQINGYKIRGRNDEDTPVSYTFPKNSTNKDKASTTEEHVYRHRKESGKYLSIQNDGIFKLDSYSKAPAWTVPTCTHEAKELRNEKEATCGEDGYTGDKYCKNCGERLEVGESIPATKKHKEESRPRDVVEATCSEKGYSGDIYCTVCGQLLKKGSVIAKIPHSWDEGTVNENGENVFTCTVCKKTKTESGSCTHEETEIRDAKDAACTEPGYTGDTYCTICEEKLEDGEEIPPVGHIESEDLINVKEATCNEEGYSGDTYCTICNEIVEKGTTITKDRNNHAWSEWEITKEATCRKTGERRHTCSLCDKTEKETIPKLDTHKEEDRETLYAKAPTCKEEGYTGDIYCKECHDKLEEGQILEKVAHQWDEGEITTQPTAGNDGVKTYTCIVCGETRTEEYQDDTPAPVPTVIPTSVPTDAPTPTPDIIPTPVPTDIPTPEPTVNTIVTDPSTKAKYKVTYVSVSVNKVVYKAPKDKEVKSAKIPAEIKIGEKTYKVTSIDKGAFKNCKKLTSVTMGKNVQTIGDNAFQGCQKLTKVTVGQNVETIGSNAFKDCKKLKAITIGKKVKTIKKSAFANCKSVTKVTIESKNLKKVEKNAFKGMNTKLVVKVPKNKKAKYERLFKNAGIKKLKIK